MAWFSDGLANNSPPRRQLLTRAGLSVGLMLGLIWLLAERVAQIDAQVLANAFAQIGARQWLLSLGFTGLSFWAIGRYDAVLHRHFATGYAPSISHRAGVCAIAVSQTLGLGPITGAILRWRMLPGMDLWQAARLTAAVALSFMAAWAVVTAIVLLVLPFAPHKTVAPLVLLAAGTAMTLSLIGPRLSARRFRWPNGFAVTQLITLCAVDSFAAAAAFHVLLPPESAIPFATLLPAFLLAFGAGLALGTPGGIGAFELTLMALLPLQTDASVLATLLGWRAIYYVLPAILGALVAIRGPKDLHFTETTETSHLLMAPLPHRAETGLTAQGNLQLALVAGLPWLIGRTGHCMIALLDPHTSRCDDLARCLNALKLRAKAENRLPVVYKASARLAATGRRLGLRSRRVGWEAWIDPRRFRLAVSSRAGLRRKLRHAEASGVTVGLATSETVPWPALTRIAQDWACTHGGERGFSMGRFAKPYLATQRIYVAWQGDQPIAFVSFHTAPSEWTLDLMRHGAHLPDGTMYALLMAAIADAARLGLPRLSLAAVPAGAMTRGDLVGRLVAAVVPETAQPGLLRFKSAFCPNWQPLYLLAPGRLGLTLAGLSLWRAICRPAPLMREIEREDADYEFASAPVAWHILRNR